MVLLVGLEIDRTGMLQVDVSYDHESDNYLLISWARDARKLVEILL